MSPEILEPRRGTVVADHAHLAVADALLLVLGLMVLFLGLAVGGLFLRAGA